MAPLDSSPSGPAAEADRDGIVRDIGFLAEHYLRNQRPLESFALLSLLEELRVEDLRLRKMLMVAAIEIRKLDIARRLLDELSARDSALTDEERRVLEHYRQRLAAAEGAGA